MKLSICIATFNRAAYIGETLRSILDQIVADVEIVILDGGSSDATEEVVREYQSRYPCIRYVRQSVNYGVDQDFDTAVGLAQGEYCWLMSDDDLLKPGAIAAVLNAIGRGYSLVVVNAEVRNHDLSKLLEERRLAFAADREYSADEMDRLFVEAGVYLSFIGCVVLQRSIWLSRDRKSHYGSLFIHVGVIFQAPLPGRALVMAQPLIAIRYGNALWKPKEFEIWMFKWPSLLYSLHGLSDSGRGPVCKREPWRQLRTLLFYRAKGTYSMTEYRRFIKPRAASARLSVGAALVALVPGWAANFVALFYCTFLHRGSPVIRRDVMNSRYYIGNWFDAQRRS